ncbi:MAG TPA: NAD(P)/FAD-dependent oxidoreductase [Candidatus Polarisedimenticolia bacterium]|nr:NAD(P)/FAD-dependent oxidoreductase [Candidatus Polarisedimenticolia bacterium]
MTSSAVAAPARAKFTVVGGGLGGALMAIFLGRAGYEVEVCEKRRDPRVGQAEEGRSINLAISARGLHALDQVGLASEILKRAIPMRGRMMHSLRGDLSFQPYGTREDQVINSVSRAELNMALLNAAEQSPNVRIVFGKKCAGVDLETATVSLLDDATGEASTAEGDVVVAADGAFSAVRHQMQKLERFDFEQSYLEHGYKEMSIPAGPNGTFLLERNALHIWPRGGYMMIALPNADGSFTCTCFWPLEGPNSFAALKSKADVLRFFEERFPDAAPLMPTLAEDFFENPTGSLVTIRCRPWHVRDRVVLLGDACHAVVPFYGQGANAAFEDCVVLNEALARHAPDRERAFAFYHESRKKNADALADLSLANFVEMRDKTASRAFLAGKRMEKILHRLFPAWFVPLYTMVTFTRIPYAEAVAKAKRQLRFVWAGAAAVVVLVLLLVLL